MAALEVETAVEARVAVKVGVGAGVAVAVEADGLPSAGHCYQLQLKRIEWLPSIFQLIDETETIALNHYLLLLIKFHSNFPTLDTGGHKGDP